MLSSLYISNYALIDKLEIDFGEGLNVITGETGSGKSIVLGALSLIMGERADSRAIRFTDRKTVVEAVFNVAENEAVNSLLTELEVETNGTTCILRRELSVQGASRSFVNDTPVNLASLKRVAALLIDIHNQNQNSRLADGDFQLQVLDSIAENTDLVEAYGRDYRIYREALGKYSDFKKTYERADAEHEYDAFLLSQLDELNLKVGEQAELEREKDLYENSANIKMALRGALDALAGDGASVSGLIRKSLGSLDALSAYIPDAKSLGERLESASIEIDDIINSLQGYDAATGAGNADIEAIERRLEAIYSLQARHKVKTDAELVAVHKKLKEKLLALENGAQHLEELADEARKAKKALVLTGRRLSESRAQAAVYLKEKLLERTALLNLPNLCFEVSLTQGKPLANGLDTVEFLFAFNKSQSLMPVGKTASGGEVARVILAIKSLLVEKMQLPTIIFDEIDTGVSGDVANRMARLMLEISRRTQVVAITHIAAVAAHGSRHYRIFKMDEGEMTKTHIRLLDDDERIVELAKMISGDADDAATIRAAKVLLNKNRT